MAFVAELSPRCTPSGKLLSVTVPPVWNDGANGYTVYAQPRSLPYVDRLRLMVYDWSITTPAPSRPMYWVEVGHRLQHRQRQVPPKKLQLGVPAYGRHWTTKKVAPECAPTVR